MLSKRLLAVYDMILENETVLDVGTDHAQLPCFLVQSGKCQKVYASDVADGPIEKARETVRRFNLEDKVICYKANGLEDMRDDVTTITISGMGFFTVRDILEGQNLENIHRLVVQVNKNVSDLRRYISDHAYTICDELVVHDSFYYEIISFSLEHHEPYSEKEIRFGPINLARRDVSFLAYLKHQADKLRYVYEKSHKPEILEQLTELENLINAQD